MHIRRFDEGDRDFDWPPDCTPCLMCGKSLTEIISIDYMLGEYPCRNFPPWMPRQELASLEKRRSHYMLSDARLYRSFMSLCHKLENLAFCSKKCFLAHVPTMKKEVLKWHQQSLRDLVQREREEAILRQKGVEDLVLEYHRREEQEKELSRQAILKYLEEASREKNQRKRDLLVVKRLRGLSWMAAKEFSKIRPDVLQSLKKEFEQLANSPK
jgi:hypothetical protein